MSPVGGRIASSGGVAFAVTQDPGNEYAVLVWDVNSVQQVFALRGHTEVVTAMAFSPDGSLLATASLDKSVRLWDMSNGQQTARIDSDAGATAFGFLGESSSVAYTASGAFVGFVRDRFGAETLAAWYGGEALEARTKMDWPAMERAWHAELDTLTLSEAALAQAKARFDRPAIFGRRCPHEVDACVSEADALAAAGDSEGAIEGYERALRLDPSGAMVEVALARARLSGGDVAKGIDALTRVEQNPTTPAHVRDRAIEILADQSLQAGEGDEAARRFRALYARSIDDDRLRTLDVKIAAATDVRARDAVVELLIGRKGRDPDRVRAAALLGAWTEQAPGDGLPWYLLARQAFNAGDFETAATELDRALAGRLDLARVAVETLRLRAVVACGLEDRAAAKRAGEAYAARPDVSVARKQTLAALIARCTTE